MGCFVSCRISTDKRVARSLCHSRATCLICYCSKHIHIIDRHLQRCLNYTTGLMPMVSNFPPPKLSPYTFVARINLSKFLALSRWSLYPSGGGNKVPQLNLWSKTLLFISFVLFKGQMYQSSQHVSCCCSHLIGCRSALTSTPLQMFNQI